MAELATIVSDLMKGKKTSENLPLYINGLRSTFAQEEYRTDNKPTTL